MNRRMKNNKDYRLGYFMQKDETKEQRQGKKGK
jgi:hypothetical protein